MPKKLGRYKPPLDYDQYEFPMGKPGLIQNIESGLYHSNCPLAKIDSTTSEGYRIVGKLKKGCLIDTVRTYYPSGELFEIGILDTSLVFRPDSIFLKMKQKY